MSPFYARSLLNAILRVFRCRVGIPAKRNLLLIMIAPFLSTQSLLDLSETCGIGKNLVYEVLDERNPFTWLQNLQREGQARLAEHLQRLKGADSSIRSRECVTICADDFTRSVRGKLGGLAHGCYSGAEGRPVYGIPVRGLVAVIGEGEEHIILDVHVVPSAKEGPGRPRYSHAEWLQTSLDRLEKVLGRNGLSMKGCYLSVDSAYATGLLAEHAVGNGLKLVSEVKASLKVRLWNLIWLSAKVYFLGLEFLNLRFFKALTGDPEVEYLRHLVEIRVYGKVLVVLCRMGGETRRFFSTDPSMKAITLRRVVKRRWQLEQVFWNLKQLLGIPTIHNQKRNRVLVRIYLTFLLSQAVKDCVRGLNVTVRQFHRTLRRNPWPLVNEISSWSASVRPVIAGESPEAGLAA